MACPPTLNEYLETFKGKDCLLVIEVKTNNTDIVKEMKACIHAYDMYGQCYVISFYEEIIVTMREEYLEMPVGRFHGGFMGGSDCDEDIRDVMSYVGGYNATLNPSCGSGSYAAGDVRAAFQRGIGLYPWTFRGDLNAYKPYIVWGYSGLMGDNAYVFDTVTQRIACAGDKFTVEPSATVDLTLDVTYYNREKSTKTATNITILEGQDAVTVDGDTLTFHGTGEVTFVLSYNRKIAEKKIVYFTQPITLTAVEEIPTTDTAEALDTAEMPDTEALSPEGGCTSVLGGTVLFVAMGAAVVLGKKKD